MPLPSTVVSSPAGSSVFVPSDNEILTPCPLSIPDEVPLMITVVFSESLITLSPTKVASMAMDADLSREKVSVS